MRLLSLFIIFSLLAGLFPAGAAQASLPQVQILAAPTSVTLVGDLQNELGCASDWDPACTSTQLTFDAEDQVWQGTFTVPAGNWLYKVATNGDWSGAFPPGVTNLNLNLGGETAVKFYFSYETKWITNSASSVIATAVGNFQSELGCSADWSPACLRSWMQDPDGDNLYTFSTTQIPAGSYEAKVALNESWSVSHPGSNVSFTVPNNGDTVTFAYNASTNAVSITVTGSGASLDNAIWLNDLGHNSRDPLYRNPGGAVPTGTPVTLRLRAASGDLELARVRVWNDRTDTSAVYNMTKVASNVSLPNDPAAYEFWEVALPASSVPTIYWYRFLVKDGTATAYYEDDDAKTGGWGQSFATSPDNSYQLSVYDPDFTTPEWIKNAVVYQIFPDRFRDGNSGNNPTAGEFFYGANDTIVRSNTSYWNTPICDPRSNFGASMDCSMMWSQNFYGGDLRGIIDELDYIDSLGVTAIYLNPIFKSPSNHKYDTTDFGQIDPRFGTLADFQELVDQANQRDIYIILDGVFNHVSSDSPYMDRYGRYPEVGACESPTSPYRDWFYFTDVTPGTGMCVSSTGVPSAANYQSWWGYDSLPKLQSNTAQVRQLIWDSASPSATQGVAPYWIMQGAKGWRLDVGGDVDPGVTNDPANDYWEGFRSAVRAQDNAAYIVGEEWGNATPWTLGGEWDATMNYQFSAAVLSFWRDTTYTDNDFNAGSSAGLLNPLTAEGVSERLRNLQERYPPQAFYAMLNLFGSHDTNRPLFLLDHNAYQNETSLYANPNYNWSDAITRLKGAALMQMTLPGAPTIYYGDEIGLVGPVSYDGAQWQDDPYNRQPYPWLDETGTPFYTHLQTATSRNALFTYYQTLISTRNANPALRTGSFDPLWEQSGSNIYAYGRKMADDSNAAIVVVNKGATTGSVTLQLGGYLPAGLTLTDVLTSAAFTVASDGSLTVTSVPARGGYLLVPNVSFAGTRPSAPVISALVGGGNQVTVSWVAVPGAAEYIVYRSRLGGGGYEQIGVSAGTSFSDTTVQPGMRYYYTARAAASNGLVSSLSNEVSALPAYTINWANLQWPPTLSAVRSLATPTAPVYGQVYIEGVTNAPGATPSLIAQVGYGNDGTLPTHSSWKWFNAAFNAQAGNNDEFAGQIIPVAAPGSYDYLYRYSTDDGNTWVYGAFNGAFYSNLSSYNPANAGDLTITAPGDTTAPAAPANLTVTGTTTDSISLGWNAHPNTDADLYGFEVWRRNLTASEVTFTRVALLAGAALTAYADSTVTANHQYEYHITAVDNSVNTSAESNAVTAIAEMRVVAITFRVSVPNPTPGTVYIAGGFPSPYAFWNPAGIALTETSPGVWETTLNILEGATVEYKYARGSWDTVEKGALHEEIGNRSVAVAYGASGTQLVTNTVANWRDPIVSSILPANGAAAVSPGATVEAIWNQPMADPIDPTACFSVSGPGGNVSGTVAYIPANLKYVFTPGSNLPVGAYTVSIGGCKDAQGDVQQAPFTSTFSVPDTTAPTTASIVRASPNPTGAASVDFTVTFSEAVTGVNGTDFAATVTSGALSGASVAGVTPVSASVYTVSVNTGTGNGTLRLDLNASGTGIADTAGNPISGGFDTGEAYTVDKISPSVTSIVRHAPVTQIVTSGSSVTFRVTFSKDVTGVDAGDFELTLLSVPGANASISAVTPVSGSVYDVAVNLASLRNANNRPNGAIRLHVASAATIADAASNSLIGLPFTSGEVYSIVQGQTFGDVTPSHWAATWVERLYYNGITTGCGSDNYCPGTPVSRAQMAIFLLRAKHGPSYTPPAVGGSTGFADVPTGYWAAAWIKQLAAEGITTGCGGGNYCPENHVTREQMAVFLLRAKHGLGYAPPVVGGSTGFADVPTGHWAAAWIKQLAAEGITTGCGGGNYCPLATAYRDQMAIFLIRTFNLP